jgi:hypothetical protein
MDFRTNDTSLSLGGHVGVIVVSWMLGEHGQRRVSSNMELAILSNVCRPWRDLVIHAVVCQAINIEEGNINLHQHDSKERDVAPAQPLLLLPSMIREHLRTICSYKNDPLSMSVETRISRSSISSNCEETFCAVWLTPSGIHEISIEIPIKIDKSSMPQRPCCNDLDAPNQYHDSQPTRTNEESKDSMQIVHVVSEWHGYRTAFQVLQPFGYTAPFLDEVFHHALYRVCGNFVAKTSLETDELYITHCHLNPTTFAVRGSIIACPDGYCNIMDDNQITLCSSPPHIQTIKEMQRDLLPRVVHLQHSMNERDRGCSDSPINSHNDDNECRVVQFLNACGSNAVCMRTDYFACGPLHGPVTVLVVGIATEDGCFLSGLKHCFELGHLYPSDEIAEMALSSAICMATDACTDCGTVRQHEEAQSWSNNPALGTYNVVPCDSIGCIG